MLFLCLALTDAFLISRLWRVLLQGQYLGVVLTLLMLYGLTSAALYWSDPYCAFHRMPRLAFLLLDQVRYPCLNGVFSFLQLKILQLSRCKKGKQLKRCFHHVTFLVTSQFLANFAIDVTMALDRRSKYLVLVNQSAFVMFGLSTCFVYVYKGFHIAQFITENKLGTGRMDKEPDEQIVEGGLYDEGPSCNRYEYISGAEQQEEYDSRASGDETTGNSSRKDTTDSESGGAPSGSGKKSRHRLRSRKRQDPSNPSVSACLSLTAVVQQEQPIQLTAMNSCVNTEPELKAYDNMAFIQPPQKPRPHTGKK